MYKRIAILTVLIVLAVSSSAQNESILVNGKDTVAYRYTPINATPQKASNGWHKFANYIADSSTDQSFERKVDMTVVPALYYSPSTSAGLAVMAAGRYRLDKQNRTIPASDFSLYAAASLTGYYRVGVKGNNIFRNDRQRIIYNADFSSQPTSFWGIGYDAAIANSALHYLASRTIVDVRFMQRIAKGLFVGAGADFNYHFGKFGGSKYTSESSFKARLSGEGVSYNAVGISLFVEFDTRNSISNPQRGVYLGIQAKVRPDGMSNIDHTLWSGRLAANYYQKLWKGAILAFDLRGEINSQRTPWVYNATIGGVSAMRGYYAGRFNDLCAITLQAELRQHLYKGIGAVAWGGAANLFHSFLQFNWSETLPTYGVGLRYQIKHNINIRLDYGFGARDYRGRLIHGAIFSINEAF